MNLTDIEPVVTSEFLDSATITVMGLTVIVDCTFAAAYLDASCVLVYREYDNPTLNVITYYKHNTSFPVSLTIDNLEKIYTFAIFGRDGTTNIDRLPLTSTRAMFETTKTTNSVIPTPTETTSVIPTPTETTSVIPTPTKSVTPTNGKSLCTSYVYDSQILSLPLSVDRPEKYTLLLFSKIGVLKTGSINYIVDRPVIYCALTMHYHMEVHVMK